MTLAHIASEAWFIACGILAAYAIIVSVKGK